MPNDDTVGKGGGVENVSKSDDVILGCSLRDYAFLLFSSPEYTMYFTPGSFDADDDGLRLDPRSRHVSNV